MVVGLGNPKEIYRRTRHNLGQMVVEKLAEEIGGCWRVDQSLEAEIIRHQLLILAKPLVFVNESGRVVEKLLRHFKLSPAELWVVHDDIDLPLGQIKVHKGRGSAGHRGVESIITVLGTKGFVRLRLGVGKPVEGEVEKFVLSEFRVEERKEVQRMVQKAVARLKEELLV